MKILALIFLICAAPSAYAWKEVGGGDEVGVDFGRSFFSAIRAIETQSLFPDLDVNNLRATAEITQILAVNESLPVHTGETWQQSVATNNPENLVIKINRARWRAITDPRLKESIALHEVLSLVGKERTGSYEYSAKYLEFFGSSPWAISGGKKPTSPIPAAKSLSCTVDYWPAGAKKPERYEFREKLEEEARRWPWRLVREKKYNTADGRYRISFWGVQPYRTAYNTTAFEFTGVSVQDLSQDSVFSAGSGLASEPRQHEDRAVITVTTQPHGNIGSLRAECFLTEI